MPQIIPIRELKNTASISKLVNESKEPIFVTKNGYGSMVMMSMEVYEKEIVKANAANLINNSLEEVKNGAEVIDGAMFLNEMATKYGK
ncbi:type II toxin-antitoxin system Phd/YefM family antitoxin [Mycoplasmatota bacterium]|nr:type II toxin-antitoxin system Phd/YefM family antitoxin [Mycoplasmatota bacterium]